MLRGSLPAARRNPEDRTYAVGSESRREVDKFARHNLRWVPGPLLRLPLPSRADKERVPVLCRFA